MKKVVPKNLKYHFFRIIRDPRKLRLTAELIIIVGLLVSSFILLFVTTSAYALMMLVAAIAFSLSLTLKIMLKQEEDKAVLFFAGWLVFYAFLLVLTLLVFNWFQEKNFGGYPLNLNNFVWWYEFALVISLLVLLWRKMENAEFMFFGLTGAMVASPTMIPLENMGWNLWQEQRIILFYFPIGIICLIIALFFKDKIKQAYKDLNYCFKGVLLTALIVCLVLMAISFKSSPSLDLPLNFHSASDSEKVLGESIVKSDYPVRLKLKPKKILKIRF